jgi:hypothetical protein
MNEAALYRLMAAKWLETAEQVKHRGLKRCYARRALTYEAMAARSELQHRAADIAGAEPSRNCDR